LVFLTFSLLPPTRKNGALDFKNEWLIRYQLEQNKRIKLKIPLCDNPKFV